MLCSLQIINTLNESDLLIISLFGVEKCLAWLGIEPTTLGHSSQSGSYDRLALEISIKPLSLKRSSYWAPTIYPPSIEALGSKQ